MTALKVFKNGLTGCLFLGLISTSAAAGWKDFDPFNKNSAVRAGCRRIDPTVHKDARNVVVCTAAGAAIGAVALGTGMAYAGYAGGQAFGSAVGFANCGPAGATVLGVGGAKVGAVYGAAIGCAGGLVHAKLNK